MIHRQCEPPPSDHISLRERDRVLDTYLTGSDLSTKQRKLALQELLHSSPSSPWIEFCSTTDAPDFGEWALAVASALLPSAPPIFQRGRWLKSVYTLELCALLANLHCLLPRAIVAWDRVQRGKDSGIQAPPRDEPIAPAPVNVNVDALVPWAPEDDAPAARFADQHAMRPGEDFAAFNERQRGDAVAFALRQSVHSELHVTVLTLQPQASLMARMLHVAGDAWQTEALLNANVQGSGIETRMGHYHSGEITSELFGQVGDLFRSEVRWQGLREKSWGFFAQAFAMICRACGGVSALLRDRHRGYPFKLFALCAAPDYNEAARRIIADPPCLRSGCGFSKLIVEMFPTAEALASDESLAILQAAGIVCRVDISRIEGRHASVRRTARTRETKTCQVAQASASFVLMRQKIIEDWLRTPQARKQGGEAPSGKPSRTSRRKRAGGGGLCRAFLSRYLKGKGKKMARSRKRVMRQAGAS